MEGRIQAVAAVVAALILAGCSTRPVIQPTRTITLTKAVWIKLDPSLYSSLPLPEFPEDPVTNQSVNDYRRAAEQIIVQCNLDRAAISSTQGASNATGNDGQ